MVNILYTHKDNAYLVPGLPYDKPKKFFQPVLLDDIPDEKILEQLLNDCPIDTIVNPWTVDVMKGLKDYIPTTFMRALKYMPKNIFSELFGHSPNQWIENGLITLQVTTEIESKAATIDAAITHYRRDLATVVNKAHLANRIYQIAHIYGQLGKEEYPFLFGGLKDPATWDTALSDMKLMFNRFLREMPMGRRQYDVVVRGVEVSEQELKDKYVYLGWLKEKLGDNLDSILLYGSASRTSDPTKYSDFDNWVSVHDIPKAHEALRGTCPIVYDGQVVEMPTPDEMEHMLDKEGNGRVRVKTKNGEIDLDVVSDHVVGSHHLGIFLIPADDEYRIKHARCLHDSIEFLLHTKVLHGQWPFPVVSQDEVVERGMSAAYIKLKTIAGSLNWAYWEPERLMRKTALFEYIVKNLRFFMQHAQNATVEPAFRDKETIDGLLAQRGIHIPKYQNDREHIKKSILYALINAYKLQAEYIASGRKTDLSFLEDDLYVPMEATIMEADRDPRWKIIRPSGRGRSNRPVQVPAGSPQDITLLTDDM